MIVTFSLWPFKKPSSIKFHLDFKLDTYSEKLNESFTSNLKIMDKYDHSVKITYMPALVQHNGQKLCSCNSQ